MVKLNTACVNVGNLNDVIDWKKLYRERIVTTSNFSNYSSSMVTDGNTTDLSRRIPSINIVTSNRRIGRRR